MGQSRYDREFKQHIVEKILNGDATITQMAQELELHYTTVRDWVKQYKQEGKKAFPGSGNSKDEDDEIRKLRKELLDLKEENAILKKAAAYFAKNQK